MNPAITFPKKVREIHKRLKKELYNMNNAFPLLVNEDMRLCYMTNIFDSLFSGDRRGNVQDIDEMITMLFDVPPEELTARFLFCFDQNKMEYDSYRPIARDIIKGTKYINSMKISDASKTVLLSALIDKEGYKKKVLEIAEKAKEVTLSIYQSYDAYVKSSFKLFEDEERIRMYLEKARLAEKNEDIIVAPVLINAGLVKSCCTDNTHLFYLGFEFYQYLSEYINRDIRLSFDDIGKLFSDKTRCDVIRILRKKESYLMDMSRELNVPNNTLHYHMQLLYDAGVVLGRNEGRRFYYRLNEKYFEAVKKLGEEFMEDEKDVSNSRT
ncbi:MAG: winged helix-turn-helix domain-containing protein [Oscillospiraceae bacterium]